MGSQHANTHLNEITTPLHKEIFEAEIPDVRATEKKLYVYKTTNCMLNVLISQV